MTDVDSTPAEAGNLPAIPEVIDANELVTANQNIVNEFLARAMPDQEESSEQAAIDIMAQVLSATSVDEVLSNLEAVGLRERLDRPMTLMNLRFNRSDYEEGNPFYALLEVAYPGETERELLTTGAKKIVAQVFRLAQLGAFPVEVVARQSTRPTKAGYYPIRLEKP